MWTDIVKIVCVVATVIATSGDDALWLVPFVASRTRSFAARLLNMFVWTATLVSLCWVAYLTVMFGHWAGDSGLLSTVFGPQWPTELCLQFFGVVLVWVIMVILLLQWCRKKQRKARTRAEEALLRDTDAEGYLTMMEVAKASSSKQADAPPNVLQDVCSVVCLTLTGGLDEVAYFPSLLLTNTYNITQLSIGTGLACIVMLVVLICFLGQCKPLLEALDAVPMWAFVAFYALLLTLVFAIDCMEDLVA